MTSHSKTARRLLATAIAAGGLTSCDPSPDPGLVEKISLLEAELRDKEQQLAAAQEEASKADEAETGAPDLDAARSAYLGFVDSLRSQLAETMPGSKFDRTSVFPVEGPDPEKPIFSRVAFRIVGKDGRSGEMVVPLFADVSGQWQEPEVDAIIASFKTKPAAPAETAASPPAQPAAPQRPQPTDVMGAGRTVEIQWNDAQPAAGKPTNPPASQPPPPAAAPAPAMPKKVMPTTRDVIIDFE